MIRKYIKSITGPVHKAFTCFTVILIITLFSSTVYGWVYLIFDSIPQGREFKESTVRFCRVPIGIAHKTQPPDDPEKFQLTVFLNEDFQELPKKDAVWAFNKEGELVLVDPGVSRPAAEGNNVVHIDKLGSAKQINDGKEKCSMIPVARRERISEIEAATLVFSKAFKSGDVAGLASVLGNDRSVDVYTEHSILEPERELLTLKNRSDVIRWIKSLHKPDGNGYMPNKEVRSISRCNDTGCKTEFVTGIYHNTLYLNKISFIYNRNGNPEIKRIELLDGD